MPGAPVETLLLFESRTLRERKNDFDTNSKMALEQKERVTTVYIRHAASRRTPGKNRIIDMISYN